MPDDEINKFWKPASLDHGPFQAIARHFKVSEGLNG
ncbi:hypothetical protein [Desulfosoma caldarium]